MFKNKTVAAAYLAGIVDGEGSIGYRPVKRSRGFVREVRITNTDERLLAAATTAMDMLGVTWRRYDRSERERIGNKPIFDLVITGKDNLSRLLISLPLQTQKADRLRAAVGSYLRGNRPTPEVLRKLVVEERLSDREIGRRYDVTPGAVYFWRKKDGLNRT